MRVVRAECAGACYGVQRALDIAHDVAAQGKPAQTLGPLIHNPQVVESLAAQGLGVAKDVEGVETDTVVIRSHGVTPEVLESLRMRDVDVIDATCPHVIRAQKLAMKLAEAGCTIVVVGEADHPEVEGLCAWARKAALNPNLRIVVVTSPSELPDDLTEPLGVVAQTTQSARVFDDVVSALRAHGLDPLVHNTICAATSERQDAAARLSSQVDAMIVIGGRNSSNTARLYETCRAHAPRTFHIESPEELAPVDFEGCQTVGITAGASTPEDQIRAVEDYLHTW